MGGLGASLRGKELGDGLKKSWRENLTEGYHLKYIYTYIYIIKREVKRDKKINLHSSTC